MKLIPSILSAVFALATANAQLSLTILHNNDGESKVLPLTGADANHGGAAYFVGLVNAEKARAAALSRQVLTLSAGDNFLAGTAFAAGLGVPSGSAPNTYYDAKVLNAIGYDAVALGNHDFDFGTATLKEFIGQTNGTTFYVNTNADFSGDANLGPLFGSKIVKSRVVTKGGVKIGIVAGITPQLPTISSPGGVTVPTATLAEIAAAINAETLAIKTGDPDVKIFVLLSHLQSITEEQALTPMLVDVDVVVCGGGSEFLRNTTNPHPVAEVLPSNVNTVRFGTYPLTATRTSDSKVVPILTTTGEYRYLGRFEVDFDAAGDIVSSSAGNLPGTTDSVDGALPVKHAGWGAGAIVPDPTVQSEVIAPVNAFIAALATNVLDPAVPFPLDGRRTQVRSRETNQGNLLADALLWKARQQAALSGGAVDVPVAAFTNGGGMRKDALIAAGTDLTELTTFEIAPFANFLAVMEDVTPAQLKSLLENAYSQTSRDANGNVQATTTFTGRFAQIADMTVTYNISAPGSTLNGVGSVIADGVRVRDVTLDDGTQIFIDGVVNPALPTGYTLDLATIDFLARGGDGYPVTGTTFTQFLGVTYQNALRDYIVAPVVHDGLGGELPAAKYGGPVGRIIPQARPDLVSLVRTPNTRTTATVTHNLRTNGYPTDVTFEYGPTASYGTSLPPQNFTAKPLGTADAVTWSLSGLQPGIVYQARITAVNELGTATSTTTFVSSPNAAPSAQDDGVYVNATTTGTPIVIPAATLLANDTDADDATLTITSVGNAVGGIVAKVGAHVLFVPDAIFRGFGSFSYTVADPFGFSDTAEVVVRSASAITAQYVGAVIPVSGGAAQDGFAALKVGKAGAISGKLLLDGTKFTFKGTIDVSGQAVFTLAGGLTFTVQFDLLGNLTTWTGTLTNGTDEWLIEGSRAADAKDVFGYVGTFNLALDADATGPDGLGYLVAKVKKDGSLSATGKLADGSSVSFGGIVTANLDVPFYTALYKSPAGSLSGTLAFLSPSELEGGLGWTKPAQTPPGTLFPAGFTSAVEAYGQRYVKPLVGELPTGFAPSPAPVDLDLSAGGLAVPIDKDATVLGTTGVFTITSANTELVALTLKPGTGQFSGTFTHPVTNVTVKLQGLLYAPGLGAGWFTTPTASGAITLAAE
jgi:5'-nucleotidase